MPQRRGAPPGPKQATALAAAERRLKVAEGMKAGYHNTTMAKTLGVSEGQIRQDIKRIYAELRAEMLVPTEEGKALSLSRMETAVSAIWSRVRAGDDKAINSLVRVEERRAKLLGLDAPTQLAGPGGGAIPVRTEHVIDTSPSHTDAVLAVLREAGVIVTGLDDPPRPGDQPVYPDHLNGQAAGVSVATTP